jgi:hypothetical protein
MMVTRVLSCRNFRDARAFGLSEKFETSARFDTYPVSPGHGEEPQTPFDTMRSRSHSRQAPRRNNRCFHSASSLVSLSAKATREGRRSDLENARFMSQQWMRDSGKSVRIVRFPI